MRHREETINTQLAILLSQLGVSAEPETLGPRARPDVVFTLYGHRIVIEGKCDDTPNYREQASDDACDRINRQLAHLGVAVIYPRRLREVPIVQLKEELSRTPLPYRIHSEERDSEWLEGTPIQILGSLRRTHEALVRDDVVEKSARFLSEQLRSIAVLWTDENCNRLSRILGIPIKLNESTTEAKARRETAGRVSALVIANALIFQEQLSSSNDKVARIREYENEENAISLAIKQWRWIWQRVNYVPIFQLAEKVLVELPSNVSATSSFKKLVATTVKISENQAALRHDLMGRIYHRLLHEAKYLGTYYTSVPAATVLLKLAFAAPWPHDFRDAETLKTFKIVDFACGTGTLLMAAMQAIVDQYIHSRAKAGLDVRKQDLSVLHRNLLEESLHGCDILSTAVHLTASTLALLSPEVSFHNMNLHLMPFGVEGDSNRIGSLDFLEHSALSISSAVSKSASAVSEGSESSPKRIEMPKIDLCVMNPPFTRSVISNRLFGSLPAGERTRLQKELKRRCRGLRANITAGLGSVFVALADKYLRKGGRLAFVLPSSLVSGEAWSPTRKLIAKKYHLEVVVMSHDMSRPNFSENTSLSEVLFLARKKKSNEESGYTRFINLRKNPASIHEALDLVGRINSSVSGVTVSEEGTLICESIRLKAKHNWAKNWVGAMFAQTEAIRCYSRLKNGTLQLPHEKTAYSIPLTKLKNLGVLGYDYRDIVDAFSTTTANTAYKAFWNNKSKSVFSLAQAPNGFLNPRQTAIPGRKLKDASAVWKKAGNILLVSRFRSNTHKVLAVRLDEKVLGNTWWTFASDLPAREQKALCLWLNSSLSFFLFLGRKVVTEGAFMQMKKPAWAGTPVLDVTSLDDDVLDLLESEYDRLCSQPLKAWAVLNGDVTRIGIDSAISTALNLPDLAPLRLMIANEPGIHQAPATQNVVRFKQKLLEAWEGDADAKAASAAND